jgi:transposase
MLGVSLLPTASNIRLIQARSDWNSIELVVATATVGAMCPCCGRLSRRVHSRYIRRLTDAPLRQVQVSVALHVRKFHCDNPGCNRSIFVERVTGFAESYARRTVQLDELLSLIAFANGGECGSRVAAEMCITISPQSLLRLIRRRGVGTIVGGRVLGIDDWSFAKRKRYGSLIVDLEGHRVVDLLPDRLAETVSAWMKAHPGIEIVSRDRGDNFIAGVTEGAPDARQVADRWHLHHNLGEMLKRLVERHLSELHTLIRDHWRWSEQTEQTDTKAPAPAPKPIGSQFYKSESGDERELRERDERYRHRHELVHSLAREGKSGREIADLTHLSRNTVRSILSKPEYVGAPQRGQRRSSIDPFKDYIAQRIAHGCINALQLFKEIAAQGFTGVYETVWRRVRRTARQAALQSGQLFPNSMTIAHRPSCANLPMPAVFEITRWLMDKTHTLTTQQTDLLQQWLALVPAVSAGRDAAHRFTEILTKRQSEQLDDWIADATTSTVTTLRQFAKGIQADHDAVLAALQLPWSNAQLEGQVNRLKVIKRQMYGRAKFDLLKIRVMTKV